MRLKELASVVPYHYNSVARWVNEIPSHIGYDCAAELAKVTGISWVVWVQGYAGKGPLTREMMRNSETGLHYSAAAWPDDSKETMAPKELLPYAPFGPAAAAEFESRMQRIDNPSEQANALPA